MKIEVTKKFSDIGIKLLNFNIINISFKNSKIEDAIEVTQILDQKIEEMQFIKLSKETQLKYLKDTNLINDDVNKSIEVRLGDVRKKLADGKGKGKASMYKSFRDALAPIQTNLNNKDQTFLFAYLSIFKNTFNANQNVYVSQNTY